MGNLRGAIRAQSRDVWSASRRGSGEKIWLKYLRDFYLSLIGLLIALIITLSITSIAGSARQMISSLALPRRHRMVKTGWHLIGRRPYSIFCQLSAFLLDFSGDCLAQNNTVKR